MTDKIPDLINEWDEGKLRNWMANAKRLKRDDIYQVAFRQLCRIGYIGKIIEHHFLHMGKMVDNERLFQYPFPDQLWTNIGHFIENLPRLPMWVDREASLTIFGGKQTYAFWQEIFESGKSPTGHKAMASGLDIMQMIKP